MSNPQCPKCQSENIYAEGHLWICPECAHEWSLLAAATKDIEDKAVQEDLIRDAFGNVLSDGDSVTVIKELKIKGSSLAVKVGTKVKSIHLVDGHDGHNISCRVDGIGALNLKSEFVKKV